jgi:hypothetical protein
MSIADIFANWKEQKFVAVNSRESGLVIDSVAWPHVVVLADVGYWHERMDQLQKWCDQNGCEQKGLTVVLPTDQALSLFCLRWS